MMRERLMVRGRKHWIADCGGKVLISYHDTPEEAKAALKELEKRERREGYYLPKFYSIIGGCLSALKQEGYSVLGDYMTCAEMYG